MTADQSCVISGLNTDLHTVKVTGPYILSAQATCVQPSGLVITLSQSGSASHSYTTPTTGAQQMVVGINRQFFCQAGDILSVSVTSAAPEDQSPGLVKTTINLRHGMT